MTEELRNTDQGIREKTSHPVGLGKQFEQFTSGLINKTRLLKVGDIPSALLVTNEYVDLEEVKKNLQPRPDGYLYGAGIGNIFGIIGIFDEAHPPAAVLAVDQLPEAVLAGRVVVRLLNGSSSFEQFIEKLQTVDEFSSQASQVIAEETSVDVQEKFRDIDQLHLHRLLDKATWKYPEEGIIQEEGYRDVISVIAAIRENWEIIKKLAGEGNIGIGIADIYDESVIAHLKKLPGFMESQNVIYTSNIIDYTQVDMSNSDPRWGGFRKKLKEINTPNNIFAFSSNENGLNVLFTHGLAASAPKDFWY